MHRSLVLNAGPGGLENRGPISVRGFTSWARFPLLFGQFSVTAAITLCANVIHSQSFRQGRFAIAIFSVPGCLQSGTL